ncbi:IclR family transcriptional regulator [Halorubrum vacuolatum]|uniref:Transcriptional regulator, IclR family n=1 Tax=Halorubrum vacuolatum TaxID=63740 RepID=A0A238XFW3_HALVU|nr:IclR family transcriptional regulator [Halorubrum vacuolatum]SNR57896.1 transcriptional regulator, IclR family [Halorubrum vacuolatum]
MEHDNVLKSVETALQLIKYLHQGGAKTVTELSNELEMPKSTVQVYLNTLCNENFIVKKDGKYQTGLKHLEFGFSALWDEPVFPEVKLGVEELANSTGELAACFVEEQGEGVYIYGAEGDRSIRTDLSIGDRSDLHCTASGKAILAHVPKDKASNIVRERGLDKKTENTITDLNQLEDELERIRERGYAFSDQESVIGMRAVAAPILLHEKVVGSISLAGPANRFVGDTFEEEIPAKVTGTANELELKLTYSESGI